MGRTAYPAPKSPDYLHKPTSVADLVPGARQAVARRAGRGALGLVETEDQGLLLVPPPPIQDALAVQAVREAYKERGMHVTVVEEDEIGLIPPRDQLRALSAADGWKEIMWRPETTAMLHPDIQRQRPATLSEVGSGDPHALKVFLDRYPKYTAVIAGIGGRPYWRWALEEHAPKFKENWVYTSHEALLSRASSFPSDLLDLIEDKVLAWITEAAEVRITDPQGTNVTVTVTEAEARHWATEAKVTGHLFLLPAVENRAVARPGDRVPPEHFGIPRVQGVIAGTGNHVGYYPHLIAHLEDGLVTRVEGGGLFGDLVREVLSRTKDAHYPHYPKPGYMFLVELALGTNPKDFRNTVGLFESYFPMPNVGERNRAGVLHFGVGVHPLDTEIVAFAAERGLPHEHGWHVHTYFTTYEVRLRSGEWLTVMDQGHLTALDDPEVRALAERYGDPDALLREDWVPAIPGINHPGDYQRDYGRDPATWIRNELEGRLPATVGVPQPS
ncbi:MAG TPA: hypothetical protein VII06_06690 [Chloroflexota bacterium]|jgi:hypothetical protein